MKKACSILFCIILLTSLLSGCSAKSASVGQANNEILTYKKLDAQKTTLVVSRTGNIDIEHFSAQFEQLNPDIQVVCLDITGGNKSVNPAADWIQNDLAPDIMFWQGGLVSDEFISKNFVNLSTDSVVDNYQSEALNNVAINGNIYCLPCPSEVECMLYNKTLFDKYGWQVPSTFDQFVALCEQITADTNGAVEPWNPNAKYSNEFSIVMQGFLYDELFAGVDNRKWYDSVMNATGGSAEHLKPMYDAVQTLIDHKILREEHFSYSATTRMNEFKAGKIAMINFKASDIASDTFEFSLMPFPSTTGNMGYVCKYYNAVLGVPNVKRTQAVQDAIERYLSYFSSEEGQRVFISDSLQISNVKNVNPPENSALCALQPAINEGHQFQLLSFSSDNCTIRYQLTTDAKLMSTNKTTVDECIEAMNAKPSDNIQGTNIAKATSVATAKKDFTILETSFYIADMYRQAAGADIGLIANNIAYRGNLMRIFAGEVNTDNVETLLPRSFANNSTLVKATMTGRQLLDALNDPVGADNKTGDCVYAFSGLKCEVAPWRNQGERMLSVTLSDGTAIDPEKQYSVAFWSGTIFDKYITEVTETFKESWVDLMSEKMKKDETIVPADDGRITLVWK